MHHLQGNSTFTMHPLNALLPRAEVGPQRERRRTHSILGQWKGSALWRVNRAGEGRGEGKSGYHLASLTSQTQAPMGQ